MEDNKTLGVKDSERSLACSISRTINNIYSISRSNDWEYFVTLTFNPKKVNSFDYDEVSKKLSQWIKNFKRRYAPDLKYIFVPELHKSGRFHFHGLIANIGSLDLIDSGKKSKGKVIYNLGNYKLGFSTATEIVDIKKTCSYFTKYITKDLCSTTFGKKRYWKSTNLDNPIEHTYVLEPSEVDTLIESVANKITYSKQVECVGYNLTTTYYELEI